jgi:hypothetical protein
MLAAVAPGTFALAGARLAPPAGPYADNQYPPSELISSAGVLLGVQGWEAALALQAYAITEPITLAQARAIVALTVPSS